ncbi:MAG: hypothetical protein IJE51_02890 [Clostridia bacterium]|nr:hypothetical protein [Clostridia bacterium]
MKNAFKRITAFLISAILMLSVLTACGETATLIPFTTETSAELNLNGYKLNVADYISSKGFTFMSYKENTNLYDAAIQRFSDVEDELNCEINMIETDYQITDLISMLLAGNVKYEAFYGSHGDLHDIAQGDLVIPASDYPDIIDVRNYDKYGTPSIQECNSYNGKIVILSPVSWLYRQPSALELLVFNMDHVNRFGKTDPREFLENGTWNWDALEHVISDYYIKEDESEIYSLVCRGFDMLKLLCLGNGVSFTYKDSDGNVKSDFGQPNMLEAIDFYGRLENEYSDRYLDKDSWEYLVESFVELQNSMACLTAAWQLYEDISYEVKNYSVLPFPTGPQGEYGIWPSAVEGMQGFEVLNGCDEPEFAFRIIDMICEPLDGYETEEARLEFLTSNVLYDIQDAEIVMNTHKNGTYSYWKAEIGNFQPDTLWREIAKNNRPASEVIDMYSNLFNQAIEEYMTPNLEISKYFEE